MKIELELTPKMVHQLRAVMDNLPLNPYAPLICTVNKALPFESDAETILGTDAAATPNPLQGRGSFSLVGFTDKGKAGLPHLLRVLSRLPHGDGS